MTYSNLNNIYYSYILSQGHWCVPLVEVHGAEGLPPLDHQPPGQQDGVGHYRDGEHQEGNVDDDVEVETELHGGCNNV